MRKSQLLSFTLVGLFVFAFSGLAQAAATFIDVHEGDSYTDAINYVRENGIVSGYSDGTYKPENPINRAEFTKILVGAALNYDSSKDPSGMDIFSLSGIGFSDIEANQFYVPYLRKAVENQIISGYSDKTFRPANSINFAEASKIIVLAFGNKITPDVAIWYRPYIQKMADLKAIPGTIKNADAFITRGEMAEMIYRIKANVTNKFSLTYDQTAGGEKKCIKVGGATSGGFAPPPSQTECCYGEVELPLAFKDGYMMSDYGSVCLEPQDKLAEAVKIYASENECTSNPDLSPNTEAPYKNQNFNGFSFSMTYKKEGCFARCDVDLDKKTATIGWMCLGAN